MLRGIHLSVGWGAVRCAKDFSLPCPHSWEHVRLRDLSRRRVASTSRTSVIQYDPPPSPTLPPPHRMECPNALAMRIHHRPRGHRKTTGVQHFHLVRFPRERRLRPLKVPLPFRGDLLRTARAVASRQENSLLGEKRGECGCIPIRHRLGECGLRPAHLLLQFVIAIGGGQYGR
jgi:hypothetical protein